MESHPILQQLRDQTRPYHDAVEQNPFNLALAAGSVTPELTAWFLGRLYGVLQPYEMQLRVHEAWFGPAWQLADRFRAPLILEDRARLGFPAAPPLCPTLPPLGSLAQLLGAMYVLEGSSLGGLVIARQLVDAGLPAPAYFTGRGSQTGPLWKLFCQQLEQAATPALQPDIVASAVLTFQSLTSWLNQP